jgi:hypothetical protein
LINNPTSWNWDEAAGYTKDEISATWEAIKAGGHFWMDLPALPGARVLASSILQRHHDLYFVTSRLGVDCKWQSETWLMENCGIELPTVLISSAKGLCAKALKLDVYIDDNLPNVLNVAEQSPETRTYLLTYAHNQTAEPLPASVTRVNHVADMFFRERLL